MQEELWATACVGAPYVMQQAHIGYDGRNLPKIHRGKHTPHGHSSPRCDSIHCHMVSALMGRRCPTSQVMCTAQYSPHNCMGDMCSANPGLFALCLHVHASHAACRHSPCSQYLPSNPGGQWQNPPAHVPLLKQCTLPTEHRMHTGKQTTAYVHNT